MFSSPYRMSSSGWLALSDVREWLRGPPGCPTVDVRPFQMFRSGGRPPDVRETSRISKSVRKDPECPGVVGKTSWMSGRPSQMSGSGREAVPDVREWSKDYLECLRVVKRPTQMSKSGRRPSRMSGSGREAVLDVQEWSRGPPECPKVVGGPPDVQEWSGDPPGCPGVVGRPSGCLGVIKKVSQMSGSGQEAFSDVREF